MGSFHPYLRKPFLYSFRDSARFATHNTSFVKYDLFVHAVTQCPQITNGKVEPLTGAGQSGIASFILTNCQSKTSLAGDTALLSRETDVRKPRQKDIRWQSRTHSLQTLVRFQFLSVMPHYHRRKLLENILLAFCNTTNSKINH
jgi:hypothetical protein